MITNIFPINYKMSTTIFVKLNMMTIKSTIYGKPIICQHLSRKRNFTSNLRLDINFSVYVCISNFTMRTRPMRSFEVVPISNLIIT